MLLQKLQKPLPIHTEFFVSAMQTPSQTNEMCSNDGNCPRCKPLPLEDVSEKELPQKKETKPAD